MPPTFPVLFVGAGPGDPDLLTVKAARAIASADVIIFDRLVSDSILELMPASVERIFAGKTAQNQHVPQDKINAVLVEQANLGKNIVRLKGGDPFVFGRGGEEALHLAKHAIPFEIVPGITSSAGCASYAGIPLTHRGLSHGVRFVTGHTQDGSDSDLNWKSLADPDTTLFIYMGLTHIKRIAIELISAGQPDDHPTAAINMGTRPEQKIVKAPLSGIADKIEETQLSGATLIVIGRVVELSEELGWFKPSQPLNITPQGSG